MSNNRNQCLDDFNIADPDQILLSIFKSTATTVTQLYKESLNQSTKSYKNGYKQCLLDLMHFASLQQHQRNLNNSRPDSHTSNQGNRIALTFDELLNFYNTKQQQINSLDDNSNSNSNQQNVNNSTSMSNDEDSSIDHNNNNKINNNNYQETNNSIPSPQSQDPTHINTIPITEKRFNFNTVVTNENVEKPNLAELKSTLNNLPSKGFTFRFNNDQFSTNFNNLHNSHHDGMKRRYGTNTINFFGKTYNFDNIDNFENIEEPPFKRNRWRRDDRMID